MIQNTTRLKVADNSGVRALFCIRVMGKSGARYATLGDEIICSTKAVTPQSTIPKGEVVRAVVVRCKDRVQREDGSVIAFDDNAAVIVDENKNPQCTRVFGPVARELRDREYMRIVSLAPEVI